MDRTALVNQIRSMWGDVLELALPTACPACGMFVEGRASLLCDVCDSRLYEARRAPACAKCASPLPDAAGPCGRCLGKGIRPFDAIARLGTFETTLRSLVHAVKYGRRWPLVPFLAQQMETLPNVGQILERAHVIVPVPLHWSRRIARGFNQSQLLAHALAKSHRLDVVNAVRRVRRTRSQTMFQSRSRRRGNLLNAFRLAHPDLLHKRHVVLIDDVMTSGATLQAVARAIRQGAKPASLSAIVLATANPLKSDLTAI